MAERINVAVIDGHPLFRQGLANAVLGSRLVVVAEGATADDARRAVQKGKPDILLLDIGVAGDGIGAAEDVLRARPTVKVVILTASDDEEDVADVLRIGVHGYILKDVSGPDLVSALEAIHRGEPYITPALASRLLMQNKGRWSLPARKTEERGLAPRDEQILGHLAKGLTNEEIARSLGVNVRTVKHYLTQVFRKMRVRNRVEALLEAQRMGLDLDGRTPNGS
jgi:DNA-binding NarL/FixJ family response regulator